MITALGLAPLQKSTYDLPSPFVGYHGHIHGGEVLLIINGPRIVHNLDGTVRTLDGVPVTVEGVAPIPVALSVWEGVRVFKPQLIINAGTAGGVKAKGAIKGKVYLIGSPLRYHDRLINFRLPGDTFEPNNYQAYGIGSFLPTPSPNLAKELGFSLGSISTGSSFDVAQGNIADQLEKNNAFLKDMEAATVAEVAQLCGIDFLLLKGVTDYIDLDHHESHVDQFEKELEPVSNIIATLVAKTINWIIGKTKSQL